MQLFEKCMDTALKIYFFIKKECPVDIVHNPLEASTKGLKSIFNAKTIFKALQ